MKRIKILIILLYITSISVYGQIEVNFVQNKTTPSEYFIVSIKNTSKETFLFRNLRKNRNEDYASSIKFVVYNSSGTVLNTMDSMFWVFSNDEYFSIEPGVTKINKFSIDAVMGYRTYSQTVYSFKAIIHLYYNNFSRVPNADNSSSKFNSFDKENIFLF